MVALVFGATGLTGSALLTELLANEIYREVRIFVRKATGISHPKLQEVRFDFDSPETNSASFKGGNHLFCCLGTTLKQAGSQAAQQKIDRDYPVKIAELAAKNGIEKYIVVSSVGADAGSSNFYLRTKGEMEQGIMRAMGEKNTKIFHPSFLLGDRKESRAGEKIGIVIANFVAPLLMGQLTKYRGINVSILAKAMIKVANSDTQNNFFTYKQIVVLSQV